MRRTAGVLTTLLLVAGCSAGAAPVESRTAERAPEAARLAAEDGGTVARARTTRFVVAISVDGLNPTAVRRLGPEGAPSLHRMLAAGAGTFAARTARELTQTLPNHTSMLTGRRILGRRGHGVDVNTDPGGTVHDRAGRYVASVFDVVHDHGRRTALYAGKDKFALFDRSWGATHGANDTTGRDNGRDKIDRFVRADADEAVDALVAQLERRPAAFAFLHLADPDQVGHEHGYLGERYLDAVRRTDAHLGRILDTVRADRFLRTRVTVLLTSDHGGRGLHHRNPAKAVNYVIPFIAWGVGVERGAGLYDLNPDRVRPARRTRTAYGGAPPIRNLDLASLATSLLGYGPVPGGLLPGTRPLEVG